MDFSLSDEQSMIQQMARKFAQSELQRQQELLGKLSGAFQNPAYGQQAYGQAQQNQSDATVAGWDNLASGVGGIADLFKKFW